MYSHIKATLLRTCKNTILVSIGFHSISLNMETTMYSPLIHFHQVNKISCPTRYISMHKNELNSSMTLTCLGKSLNVKRYRQCRQLKTFCAKKINSKLSFSFTTESLDF